MSDAPTRIGKYEILQTLGAGAMGVVYLAYDAAIDRKVAVKTIRKDLLDGATASRATARFRQEAMAAGRLSHPGIVAVYDYGEDESLAYIVMEYAPGEDLARHMAGRTLALPEIGALMGQLLDALGYAHQAGVVHRDIKPANLLLSGRLKITDFGIARIAHSQLTRTGSAMGTPAYMAPEQYRGVGVDHRVDLFASGVLLYEMLAGVQPFDGDSIEQIAYRVLHEEPAPPTRIRAGLPPGVDAVVARALAKTKEARFQTAAELAQALTSALSAGTMGGPGGFVMAPTMDARPGMPTNPVETAGTGPSRVVTGVTPEAMARVTQTLAKYVGPIAKVMVKKAGGEASTYRDLCLRVSARLGTDEERARFLKEVGLG